ncbi:MAG: hypothetical protein A3J38_06205 [Gammaproteobacteria bacterium RIFCSPHIGHO2_12_FULL_45_9]|nr:MAG: hypothetical protein A3J38_06205 [Gammaproteobacteria bacterium RIFCSPHIGHO2_12_FULL_45_9]
MMDDKKNTSSDEYQFPQEEYVASDQSSTFEEGADPSAAGASDASSPFGEAEDKPAQKKTVLGKLGDIFSVIFGKISEMRNKRILVVVAAIILLLLIVRAVHNKQPSITSLPSKPEAKAEYTAPTEQTEQPIVEEAKTQTFQPPAMPSMEQPSSASQAELKKLMQEVGSIQDELQDTRQTNQALEKSMHELTTQVQLLSSQLSEVAAKLAPKKTPGEAVVYHLRAVVPDRAWIISNKGETLTVAVGDKLDHYGTVDKIDAQNGMIETSSGQKISYGVNDF